MCFKAVSGFRAQFESRYDCYSRVNPLALPLLYNVVDCGSLDRKLLSASEEFPWALAFLSHFLMTCFKGDCDGAEAPPLSARVKLDSCKRQAQSRLKDFVVVIGSLTRRVYTTRRPTSG